MNSKFAKAYAAYVSGWLGKSIYHAWFMFFAELLLEQEGDRIEIVKLRDSFGKKYGIRVPIDFVKKTLEICGSSCITMDRTMAAIVDKVRLQKFSKPEKEYKNLWKRLCSDFNLYLTQQCNKKQVDTESLILECIEQYDIEVVSMSASDIAVDNFSADYIWNKYVKRLHDECQELYDFVCSLCYGSIAKDAILRTGDSGLEFRKLTVYIDTPLIFHLLGISEKEECESSQYLVTSLREAGCDVRVFNHTIEEVEGVARSAKKWALDVYGYNAMLANKTARYFRSQQMTEQQIEELICNIQGDLLDKYGIKVDNILYDDVNRRFQIDENVVRELFINRLKDENNGVSYEVERRIKADIRSMAMLYHKRGSVRPKNFQQCRVLMVTPSKTLASVCKEYQRGCNEGGNLIVPVCLSSKVLASMLWAASPKELNEYKKLEILADCARFLRPTDAVLRKFFERFPTVDSADRLTREKYFLLTSSPIMEQTLMDVSSGEIEHVTDNTIEEVYERIRRAMLEKHTMMLDAEHLKESHEREMRRNKKLQKTQKWCYWLIYPIAWAIIIVASARISFWLHTYMDDKLWIGFFVMFIFDGVVLTCDVHMRLIRDFAKRLSIAVAEFLMTQFSV